MHNISDEWLNSLKGSLYTATGLCHSPLQTLQGRKDEETLPHNLSRLGQDKPQVVFLDNNYGLIPLFQERGVVVSGQKILKAHLLSSFAFS